MYMAKRRTDLGIIYLPNGSGTPVGKFQFVVDPVRGTEVEIGTAVTAETPEGCVTGIVVDMATIGANKDPLAADLRGRADEYVGARIADVPEVMLATAQVFYSEHMRPIRFGKVRAATVEEMEKATGKDVLAWGIPAGVLPLLGGKYVGINFDGAALLGPESGHIVIGGLSGQAAKTSFAGVLLKSAITQGAKNNESVGAIIFNVKGDDLCYLDQPPGPGYELSDEDKAMYKAMSISATPFKGVSVYSPGLAGGAGVRSGREDAKALRWDLRQVWPYMKYLIPQLGDDEKLQSFIGDFEMRCLNAPLGVQIDTFARLEAFFKENLEEKEENEEAKGWRSHHPATLVRLRRMLTNLPARCGGLLTQGNAKRNEDIPAGGWKHGDVVVVDVAGLNVDIQGLVIARTVERLLKSADDGTLGVDHLVVFADELNSFAPSQGAEMAAVRTVLEKVAKQGRSSGVSVWGAAQKLSKISDLLVSNTASRALGITADSELNSGLYGNLSGGLAERIATLPKGQMALWHYSFRSAIVVKFPRPAWRTGKSKTTKRAERKTNKDALKVNKKSLERLTEGLSDDEIEAIIAGADDPKKAVEDLNKARKIDMSKRVVKGKNTADPSDPFGID